tara:strand:+ start:1397 stop:2065 length:669 start_codon:yes stop_codon:yes gene_type:complete
MELKDNKNGLILGLDVSTKTIGIALFEDTGDGGKLRLLHHVSPKIKPKPEDKLQELFEKANIFEEEFLNKYTDVGITRVIIEEPLLRSNNVNTVATLLRFNGMISRSVYDTLGIVPEFISSYDSRKFAFPELMQIRRINKKGQPYSEREISKKNPVLFGGYDWDVDKKIIVWEKVADLEPQVTWLYTRTKTLKKENFDMTDAYCAVKGHMAKTGEWSSELAH